MSEPPLSSNDLLDFMIEMRSADVEGEVAWLSITVELAPVMPAWPIGQRRPSRATPTPESIRAGFQVAVNAMRSAWDGVQRYASAAWESMRRFTVSVQGFAEKIRPSLCPSSASVRERALAAKQMRGGWPGSETAGSQRRPRRHAVRS